jgi:TPR repeat protein
MIAKKSKIVSVSRSGMAANQSGSQSTRLKSRTSATAKKKQLGEVEAELVKLFRAHWRSVNAKIVRGVDVARKRAHMFFATNDHECLRLARRYYSPTRAAKLATASDEEILRLSEPWLSAVSAVHESPSSLSSVELRPLVAAEYVALVWRNSDYPEFPPKDPALLVAPLPDESVGYGDVYEITASGLSVGSGLRVCKSVAEPFLKSERREAEVGIEQEFYENARSDDYPDAEHQWQVAFLEVTDRRAIDVDITENFEYSPCFGEPQSDLAGAAAKFRKEAEQGSVEAQMMLADYYTNPNSGIPEDRVQAAIWYRKAAEQGNSDAQLTLGGYYYRGIGVMQDFAQAAFWNLEAEKLGQAQAQHNIASMYRRGRGVRKSYKKAALWYSKAAEHDYHWVHDAQFQLGILYKKGLRVPRDYAKAAVWFRKAAKRKNYEALVNLGEFYAEGRGLVQNYAKATSCFRKAASNGNPYAQIKLGECYAKGQGVRKSFAEAYFWLCVAALRANGEDRLIAKKGAKAVSANMTPGEVLKEKKRVKDDLHSAVKLNIRWPRTEEDIF